MYWLALLAPPQTPTPTIVWLEHRLLALFAVQRLSVVQIVCQVFFPAALFLSYLICDWAERANKLAAVAVALAPAAVFRALKADWAQWVSTFHLLGVWTYYLLLLSLSNCCWFSSRWCVNPQCNRSSSNCNSIFSKWTSFTWKFFVCEFKLRFSGNCNSIANRLMAKFINMQLMSRQSNILHKCNKTYLTNSSNKCKGYYFQNFSLAKLQLFNYLFNNATP